MELFSQLIFTGLGIGSVYALVSLGFVLLIRAAGVVNFAQGEFSMIGAYIMVILFNRVGLPYYLALVLAVALMGVFGIVFAAVTYWPLRHRGQLPVIISTIGASILLTNLVLSTYGPSPQILPGLSDSGGFEIAGVFMDSQYLAIFGVTGVTVLLQYFVFERTMLGKMLQATCQDKEMAGMLGVSVTLMILITFAYSSALGGLAGILISPLLFVSTGMGAMIAMKAFAANIIGGYGSIPGAILGGLIIGLSETLGGSYISMTYKDAFAFVILMIVLLISPRGIFGETISEKA
jgi:branched-chain amino acid transport system permease protein